MVDNYSFIMIAVYHTNRLVVVQCTMFTDFQLPAVGTSRQWAPRHENHEAQNSDFLNYVVITFGHRISRIFTLSDNRTQSPKRSTERHRKIVMIMVQLTLTAVHGQHIKSICFVQMTRNQWYKLAAAIVLSSCLSLVVDMTKIDPFVQVLI